jgi:hypothetical protein
LEFDELRLKRIAGNSSKKYEIEDSRKPNFK